ncbi:flagellar basal-body MS-ring/collar protein FliF [Alkaliphilus transvaalensis]|uniref:flagellar basal-body MS-ring/collar protein FliF n=1 Tax=Alkaliphilus transvaalensis TaxID=114628 RepID=UPI00047AD84C|nr:flagellar basal-body MS-ring/collar protein FliF [Alkaliphilus transvaalensis]
MAEAFGKVGGQFTEYFQSLEKKQKIKIGLSALFILVTFTGLILYFTKTDYVVLYNNLEARQSGDVLNVLESSNIKAKFGENSSTILVAKEDLNRAQVVVATQGLPSARFTYEDAFSNSFMMTSEERSQRFLVAQQNHLAQTLEEMPGVRRAVVLLTVPEKSGFVFSGNDSSSKAAVWLDFETFSTVDAKSINGMATLVANSVEGLEIDNVTIHGSDGRVLNSQRHEGDTFDVSDQIALNQVVSKELEDSIYDFLSTVYGYGNIAVKASVRLDFDSEVTEIKEFSPPIEGETTGIIRSMQRLHSTAVNQSVGGVPGTDTNGEIPQYVEAEETESRYEEANETINYEINELRRKIVKAEGQVKDITVAVFVNSRSLSNGELSDEERRDLQNIISAAAGLDTRVVQVGVQEFNNSLEDQLRTALETVDGSGASRIPLWLLGLIATLVIAGVFLAVTQLKKRNKVELPPVKEIIPQEELEEIDLELSGSQAKQQIEKLVNKNPEAVAQLLRNWLSEE